MGNQQRLERQIERLERRLERAGALYKTGQAERVKQVAVEILSQFGNDLDLDDDGEIRGDELAAEVVKLVNKLLPIPEIAKIATEWTAVELVEAVVIFTENRGSRLERRLSRKRAKLD